VKGVAVLHLLIFDRELMILKQQQPRQVIKLLLK